MWVRDRGRPAGQFRETTFTFGDSARRIITGIIARETNLADRVTEVLETGYVTDLSIRCARNTLRVYGRCLKTVARVDG